MTNLKYKDAIMYGSGHGYANENLRDELREFDLDPESLVINLAYTDYGGDILDKIFIRYFKEEHPKSIVSEDTCWNGENAFIFGDIAKELWEQYESYSLGFENVEEYYFKEESEVTFEAYTSFVKDLKIDYQFNSKKVMALLMEERSGYYSLTPTGLDYSTDDLIKFLTTEKMIKSRKELEENQEIRHMDKSELPLHIADLEYESSKNILEKRLKGRSKWTGTKDYLNTVGHLV